MAPLQAKRRLAPSQQERAALPCLAQGREDAEKAVDCPAIGVLPCVIGFDLDALLLRGEEISLDLRDDARAIEQRVVLEMQE